MKRTTAATRTMKKAASYRKNLHLSSGTMATNYAAWNWRDCALCRACAPKGATEQMRHHCKKCLDWPSSGGCGTFIKRIDGLKTTKGKLALVARLEAELARWAKEEHNE